MYNMGNKGPVLQDKIGHLQGMDHPRPCRYFNDFGLYVRAIGSH